MICLFCQFYPRSKCLEDELAADVFLLYRTTLRTGFTICAIIMYCICLIWREPGTRYSSIIRERDAYGGGSIWVWGGISLSRRTDLHVFPRGTVAAQVYRNDILDAYVLPYAGTIGDNFILQDKATPHRALIVKDYLQQQQFSAAPS